LIALVLLAAACLPTGLPVAVVSTPTPLPPMATPTPTASPTPTSTPTATPSPTPTLTATPATKEVEAAALVPTATPTPDRLVWVVTEEMINEAFEKNKLNNEQLEVRDLSVQFTDGQAKVSAGLLRYSFLSVNNLQATISVWAEGGKVRMRFERLQPDNLMTRLLPGMAAQLLEQYTAGWYVQDIRIGEGEMTIVVRP